MPCTVRKDTTTWRVNHQEDGRQGLLVRPRPIFSSDIIVYNFRQDLGILLPWVGGDRRAGRQALSIFHNNLSAAVDDGTGRARQDVGLNCYFHLASPGGPFSFISILLAGGVQTDSPPRTWIPMDWSRDRLLICPQNMHVVRPGFLSSATSRMNLTFQSILSGNVFNWKTTPGSECFGQCPYLKRRWQIKR